MTITLDNLTGFWVPDTHLVYGENCERLGLTDTRTIAHDQRFLLTTNDLDPKAYIVTKVVEVSPIGLFRYSIKQDEFNPKRDNIKLRVCDYYTNMGDVKIDIEDEPSTEEPFSIMQMTVDESGELIEQSSISPTVTIGSISYYKAIKSGCHIVSAVWNVELIDGIEPVSDTERKYLEGLIKITAYDDNIVAIKPAKANSLIGRQFKLVATRDDGDFRAEIEWEVESNGT